MDKILNLARGWKTYLAGLSVIGVGFLEGLAGVDVPGVEVGSDWLGWVIAGLTVIFIRKGIKESAPGA